MTTTPNRPSPSPAMDPQTEALNRLTEALERAWRPAPAERRHEFEAPHYEGKGDVELFVRQFTDVAEANEWPRAAALLHLRKALREGATDCGRAESVEGIFTALRARYGLTPREARAKIASLKRESKTTLQEHSVEVERLVEIAYAEVPGAIRTTMAVDTFASTIGNGYLQRHLLAVPTPTLEAAVRAGNEYLQIQTGRPITPRHHTQMVDDGGEDDEETIRVIQGSTNPSGSTQQRLGSIYPSGAISQTPGSIYPTGSISQAHRSTPGSTYPMGSMSHTHEEMAGPIDPLMLILESIQRLTDQMARVEGGRAPQKSENSHRMKCFNCGQQGHTQRECGFPTRAVRRNQPPMTDRRQAPQAWGPPRNARQPAGNANRPQ